MIEFYAYRVINGKTTYSKVPAILKSGIADFLRNNGYENLITEEEN